MAQILQEKNSSWSRGDLSADFFKTRINLAIVGFLLVGIFLVAIGAGLFFFKNSGSDGDDIQIISSVEQNAASQEVVVHMDGAVARPGVYKLSSGARINDAIAAAGGLTTEADETRINLAAKVADGQKIYIWAVGQKDGGMVGGTAGVSVSALVNINTASESELDKLPGVGPVTAGKIIASRPYSALEDLKTRKVVSASVFEKIRDLITVY